MSGARAEMSEIRPHLVFEMRMVNNFTQFHYTNFIGPLKHDLSSLENVNVISSLKCNIHVYGFIVNVIGLL